MQVSQKTSEQAPSYGIVSATDSRKLLSRDLLEITIAFLLIMIALWSGPVLQKVIGAITFSWIVLSTLRSRQSADALGLGLSGVRRSLWIVCTAMLAAALVIWIASRMHTLHVVRFRGIAVESSVLAYMLWAVVQQFILQDFFLARLLRILPTPTTAVIVAAGLFAVAHLPNPVLTVATLAWGIVACGLFLRYRNVYSLGIAHGILGLCLAIAIPNTLHHQMRVGIGYIRWHAKNPEVHRSHIDQMVSTDAWVMADATSRRSSRQARP